jgi:hypothetical protein
VHVAAGRTVCATCGLRGVKKEELCEEEHVIPVPSMVLPIRYAQLETAYGFALLCCSCALPVRVEEDTEH